MAIVCLISGLASSLHQGSGCARCCAVLFLVIMVMKPVQLESNHIVSESASIVANSSKEIPQILTSIQRGGGALGALHCLWSDTCSVPWGGTPDAACGFAAPTSTALPPSQVQGVHSVWVPPGPLNPSPRAAATSRSPSFRWASVITDPCAASYCA